MARRRSGRRTLPYGPAPDQLGDLHLPDVAKPPVVCLFHGGFWRAPYGRDQFEAVARDLAQRGHAVWNVGYRRLGGADGGWPGTLDDALAAVEQIAAFVDDGIALDLARVTLVGHSAGGHLALWAAGNPYGAARRVRPLGVVAYAAVSDLKRAHALGLGNGAVTELLGGTPQQQARRYAIASPIERLPLGARQLLMHGTADDVVPIALSRDYAAAARAAGDAVELVELPGAGHMEFLDPKSAAHQVLCDWLAR